LWHFDAKNAPIILDEYVSRIPIAVCAIVQVICAYLQTGHYLKNYIGKSFHKSLI
jgi:hypothetical protein